MMYNSWVNLNHHWQSLLYKEWLLFIKERFPLSTFLWDDSYGLDFLLCKALNLETSKPEDEIIKIIQEVNPQQRNRGLIV